MNWYEADAYCKNLKEGGYSDWRLPIIDELRTIIKDCDRTGIRGECRISENNGFLSLDSEYSGYHDVYTVCDCKYKYERPHNFSIFGDGGVMLWSASSRSDNAVHAWGVDFSKAGIFYYDKSERSGNVRCIRQEEHDFCETVKKHPAIYYWRTYLDTFPNGECAAEFKKILKVKDREACENIRKQDQKADPAKENMSVGERFLPWINYVKDFPNGECSSEVKKNLEEKDKEACSTARAENTRATWENYLYQFPCGKCAEDANKVRNKYRKISGFEWSDVSFDVLLHEEAEEYCENLREGGLGDWRLPDIEELRVLVQNHFENTDSGKCAISAKNGKKATSDKISNCDGTKYSNFSKLGDTEQLLSSTEAEIVTSTSVYVHDHWLIDFSTGEDDMGSDMGQNYFRCVRQDDSDACEAARKEETDEAWEYYLFYFPNGKCAKEAKAGAKEEAVCERARKANTRAAWEKYLKKFPNGKCAKEGKAVRNKFKRIGTIEWSDVIEQKWDDDNDVCENLKEGGYTDWRKPNIDELRTLVQNNPGTVTGGKCRISEKDGKLINDKYWDKNCSGIGRKDGNFSKLGDNDWFWSSSHADEEDDLYWAILFDDGTLSAFRLNFFSFNMRCVRQDEPDACETAKKYNDIYYWKHYLENFPQGKCAAEAKNKIKEKEAKKVESPKWSSRSRKAMSWKQANQYCENLKEGGSSDWRLPTISELRTLVMKCGSTETGGTCMVTDQCLSEGQCKNKVCRGCGSKIRHNKFGDRGFFWSSSISPDNKNAWYIDFTYGSIHNHSNSDKFVRCVR